MESRLQTHLGALITLCIKALLIFLVPFLSTSFGAVESPWKDGVHKDHCDSAEEFRQVHKYLKDEKSLEFSENEARNFGTEVAKGCTNAARRFIVSFELLKKSGVDLKFSAKSALKLAHESDASVDTFVEAFKHLYLENILDLDYRTAYQVAWDLAKEVRIFSTQIGEDFTSMVKFCLNSADADKGIGLPQKECLQLGLKLARWSKFFPEGAYQSFEDFYRKLKTDQRFAVSTQRALEIAMQVLERGPKAPKNFLEGFGYALSKDGLNESAEFALKHALKMANLSNRSEVPPQVELP